MPIDPVTDSAALLVTANGGPANPSAATGGWAYDTVSGKIIINSNALDSKSVAYFER